jgi:hypothetical protein
LVLPDDTVWRYWIGRRFTRIIAPDDCITDVPNSTLITLSPRRHEGVSVFPSDVFRWLCAARGIRLDKSTGNR